MDWIKVLTRHALFEYTDLRDSEYAAWIKIMALTAHLEHEPSYEQILKHVHHKTLRSLQEKLKKHSTTLQDVLKKVLTDVQEVAKKRRAWRDKKKKLREDGKNVQGDVSGDVSGREERRGEGEEIREEKETPKPPVNDPPKREKKKKSDRPFVLPEYIPPEIWQAYLDVRVKKRAAKTDHALWLIVEELEKIKAQHHQDPLEVLKKSIRSGWTDVYPLKGNGAEHPMAGKVANTQAFDVIKNWRPPGEELGRVPETDDADVGDFQP